jgi:hypothetical protein
MKGSHTVDMQCRKDDTVNGGNGWKDQGGGQAGFPEPFCFPREKTSRHQDVVSAR